MHHLVYNKNSPYHFYKKSGHLVRTPITLTLQADEMAVYQVAGTYRQQGNVWWADSGFIAQSTIANVTQMGYDCIQALLNHSDWRMGWGQVTTSHHPEMVWYQGAYATSAPNLNASLQSCEAYCQLAAYHFTLPSGLQNLDITEATIKFINGGVIVCYQGAFNQSSNNLMWINSSPRPNPIEWNMRFSVAEQLGHIQQISTNPYVSFDLATATGTPRGARDLWGRSGTNADGGIPTLTTPQASSVDASTAMISAMQSNMSNGYWLVAWFNPAVTSSSNYLPRYVSSNAGYWACASMWDITMQVTVD